MGFCTQHWLHTTQPAASRMLCIVLAASLEMSLVQQTPQTHLRPRLVCCCFFRCSAAVQMLLALMQACAGRPVRPRHEHLLLLPLCAWPECSCKDAGAWAAGLSSDAGDSKHNTEQTAGGCASDFGRGSARCMCSKRRYRKVHDVA
jgi:hypothetical protein